MGWNRRGIIQFYICYKLPQRFGGVGFDEDRLVDEIQHVVNHVHHPISHGNVGNGHACAHPVILNVNWNEEGIYLIYCPVLFNIHLSIFLLHLFLTSLHVFIEIMQSSIISNIKSGIYYIVINYRYVAVLALIPWVLCIHGGQKWHASHNTKNIISSFDHDKNEK